MRKLALIGIMLAVGLPGQAAVTDYDITGFMVSQENICTQVTILFAPGRDCSYGDTREFQTGAFLEPWLGPVSGSVFYTPGGAENVASYVPFRGDNRISVPITGVWTIDDKDTADPDDDDFSAVFDIGEAIRQIATGNGTRAAEGWTSVTHTMPATQVSSTSDVNGNGGFDYIIAANGAFPNLICATGVTPDPASPDCFPTDDDLPSTPAFNEIWATPPQSAGVGIGRAASFAPGQDTGGFGPPYPPDGTAFGAAFTTAVITGYNCVDTGAGDCPPDTSTAGQGVPGNGSTLLIGGSEDAGFDNLIISLKTDASGAVTEAMLYYTQESFVAFNPFVDPQDLQPDNSWSGGRIAFTGQAQVSFDAVDDPNEMAAEGVATVLDVLANDVGLADGVIVGATQPANGGSVVVAGSGGPLAGITVTYTSEAPLMGNPDTFTYTIDNGVDPMDTATVTVTRQGSGANDDTAATRLNAAINIDALANDSGFVDPVTVSITANPDQGGSVTINGTNPGAIAGISFDYIPVAGLNTPTYTEMFTYQVTDGVLTDTADVVVTVNNAVPAGAAGSATTDEDTPVDTDIAGIAGVDLGDGATPTIAVSTQAMNGMASVNGTTVTYTPNMFFSGMDTYQYTITDEDNETSTPATVTVTVNPIDPVAMDDAATVDQGGSVDIDVTANDMEGSGAGNGDFADHAVTVPAAPANGSTAVANNIVTYTPDSGFNGMDQFDYQLADANGDSTMATVVITVDASGIVAKLPGNSNAIDPWSLLLMLLGAPMLRRKIAAA